MKTLIALLLVAFGANLLAQEAPKPLGSIQEGVYFSRTENMTNVLELKNGHFRRWAWSVGSGARNNPNSQPGGKYFSSLTSGDYTTNGGTIKFVTEGSPRQPFFTNELSSMEFKGKVTLWSSTAQNIWEKRATVYPRGVLELTDRKPEEILEGK